MKAFFDRIKQETAVQQRALEDSPFGRELATGSFAVGVYHKYTVAQYIVYLSLEGNLDACVRRHKELYAAHFPEELGRSSRLEADLHVLLESEDWNTGVCQHLLHLPAIRAYIGRLSMLATKSPHRLLAHAYVRYMGELSVHHRMKHSAAKGLGIRLHETSGGGSAAPLHVPGLSFYDFDLDDPVVFQFAYKAAICNVLQTQTQRKEFIEETKHAFEMNAAVMNAMLQPMPVVPVNRQLSMVNLVNSFFSSYTAPDERAQ